MTEKTIHEKAVDRANDVIKSMGGYLERTKDRTSEAHVFARPTHEETVAVWTHILAALNCYKNMLELGGHHSDKWTPPQGDRI